MSLFPVELYERGYTDLISVVPPNGPLSPGSKITPDQRGKVPGRRLPNGTWAGYNWRAHRASLDEVRYWAQGGANFGLRAGNFPGLDIDSLDAEVVGTVASLALAHLGPAPKRVGRAPKALLMYRASAPFQRMRVWLKREGAVHLIEMLGEGQQYLVHGVHPGTMLPYEWTGAVPAAAELTEVTAERITELLGVIRTTFEALGFEVRQEGDGRRTKRTAGSQAKLRAPSTEVLAAAVALMPNTLETREEYVKFGYAVKAAAGDDDEGGFEVFSEWAARWEGGANAPDTVRSDWRRMEPPYSVGWPWIAEHARAFGFEDATLDFDVIAGAPPEITPARPRPAYSDAWLARRCIRDIGNRLRYVAQTGQWLVWDGARWKRDDTLGAQADVHAVLSAVASEIMVSDEKGVNEAKRIESAHVLMDVLRLLRADRDIAVPVDALDANIWQLSTPAGVVDLRTGAISAAKPDQLHTKSTLTGPGGAIEATTWHRYLAEATGGDMELYGFMQRFSGYCLTGSTAEQKVAFVWGPGGTGKSIFLNALREIMGDYATVASMATFTASEFDRHSTELAALCGARMVTASETQEGRGWDEQRLKAISGGEAIKARFMRQDEFMFMPRFKLLFSGNHQPNVRSIDKAIRRRLMMIPFTREPAKLDLELGEKLKAEYPAILAWMIQGCLLWQRDGLAPPAAVFTTTEEYFETEDLMGEWLGAACVQDPAFHVDAADLFQRWREWCGERREKTGTSKTLVQSLKSRGFRYGLAAGGRGAVYGLKLKPYNGEEFAT